MRRLTARAAVAALALAAPICAADAADKVKVAIPGLNTGYAMYFVALDKGYFAQESIEVEIIQAGGGTATPALISGDIQFTGSPGVAVSAILRGGALKLMYAAQDRPPYQLWASEPEIKTVADLKGKRIGVISLGDTHDLAVRLVLATQGLAPSDVMIAAMGPGAGRLAGLTAGSLAAASLQTDEVDQARQTPKLHLLADTSAMIRMVAGGAATTERMLTADRPLAKRFVRALAKGHRYVMAFADETVDAVRRRDARLPREVIAKGYAATLSGLTKDGTVPVDVQRKEIEVRGDLLGVARDKLPPPEKVFDFSLMNEVNRELDAQGWTPSK